MIFKNIYEARKWFLNYQEFEVKLPSFCYEYDYTNWKFGDHILFQHIKDPGDKISRPILGIFTAFSVWDQALVINFVQDTRAWMSSHEIITNPELDIKFHICTLDSEIENIQFWTDNIHVLGHWINRPSKSELRQSLSNEITGRNTKIDNLLK